MKVMRFVASASIFSGMAFVTTGGVLASDASIQDTGSGSSQTIVINSSSTVSRTTTNVIDVSSRNVQQSTTGDVVGNKNTYVGGDGLSSGDALNQSDSRTVVSTANQPNGSDESNGGGNNSGNGGAVSENNGSLSSNSGHQILAYQGGSVLGAASSGGGILPSVGASAPMDVSGLRAALMSRIQSANTVPVSRLVAQARDLTGLRLMVATVLSLVAAIGTAVHIRRKEGEVL